MRKSIFDAVHNSDFARFKVLGILIILGWIAASCSSGPHSPQLVQDTGNPGRIAVESTPPPTVQIESLIGPTPRPRRLKPGELVLASDIDAIPAIFAQDELFVDALQGDAEWDDAEPVVGVAIEGDARAYPVRLLSLHEIVNDVVGGQPVAVTWCPLCYSSIVFNRVVERELTFGVSGYLYFNNLVMYDHQSNTLWSQMLGQGIKGAFRGSRLEILPSLLTTWRAWKELHPETRVLSAARLGKSADEVVDPYVGYYSSGAAGVAGWTNPDGRLKPKQLVIGVVIGEQARAYSVEALQEASLIHDQLGGLPLLIVYDEGLESVAVYLRSLEDRVLSFMPSSLGGIYMDEETGSQWDLRSGNALAGTLEGIRLTRVSAPMVFWFAWSDLHPNTEVFNG